MSQVYPIARGSAPLLTTLVSVVVLREAVAPLAGLGIALLCAGVGMIALSRGKGQPLRPRPWPMRADRAHDLRLHPGGRDRRTRGRRSPRLFRRPFVVDGVPLLLFVLWRRGRAVLEPIGGLVPGMIGGLLSLGSYWIAIWAMTVAPIALVAACARPACSSRP